MKELLIIGTVHLASTPKDELEDALRDLRPDNVLVELSPEELQRPRDASIRDDMFAAFDWAKQNGIPVSAFDVENDILKNGVAADDPAFAAYHQECDRLLHGLNWKDLNKEGPWQRPEVVALEKNLQENYLDKEKLRQRDISMAKNIARSLCEGRNVVVTGVGHLSFFKEQFPRAIMPFRS